MQFVVHPPPVEFDGLNLLLLCLVVADDGVPSCSEVVLWHNATGKNMASCHVDVLVHILGAQDGFHSLFLEVSPIIIPKSPLYKC